MSIDMKLGKLSDQIRHRNAEEDIKRALEELTAVKKNSALEQLKRVEIDYYAEDERGHHSEEMKIEKDNRDRKSELERLRAAVSAVEMANHLNPVEEETAELRRKTAAGRRSTTLPAQSWCKNKKISTQRDEVEDEGGWERKEAEGIERPVKPTSKIKMNPYKPPRRLHEPSKNSTDDEEQFQRTAHQKFSSMHIEETEDQLTDEEKPPPPKKSSKVNRKPHLPPHEVDDLIVQFQGFGMPLRDNPHEGRSGLPMPIYSSPYGSPFPSSMAPYGYAPYGYGYGYGGGGAGSVVNTGVGNITNTTISNVGNDNSVKKVYRR
jgi:hypothetical protein